MKRKQPGRKAPAAHVEGLGTSLMHTVRVWQVAPIRTRWTAVLPVRAGREEAARRLVTGALARNPDMGGEPPRNAVGLLEPEAGRRGMRFDPSERASWPPAALYLEFMPAGSDMVYAQYELAHHILEGAAPLLVDARWYAILTQCEDILDCWEISAGRLRYERHQTEEDQARELLQQLEPSLRGRLD
ncbi:hypothetical protein HPC49_00450 [Pyxidicoccus fallax]|uniref:Uncharacterized protein n=1 Tax=Pyxidicoccus fallax TaxID=394095 RepID=A0A848LDR0_9BACT|nr:hypothetical protein [Pyxidicoccus fallax]NMO13568.1 hypothetical protein [Pyxidicoccus fallax]NPC76724.1 hypothetical protein [Pyxidicoccus fallax]